MKTTGVVRRIDDLGRIVIPKEIRKTLHIRDGESMEIYVDNEFITLKKYSSFDGLSNISKLLVDSINSELKKNVFITDMNRVIAYSGNDKKKYIGINISHYLEEIINERKGVRISKNNIQLLDSINVNISCVIYPIIANGDVNGAIVLMSEDEEISDNEDFLIKVISEFLGKNIEE